MPHPVNRLLGTKTVFLQCPNIALRHDQVGVVSWEQAEEPLFTAYAAVADGRHQILRGLELIGKGAALTAAIVSFQIGPLWSRHYICVAMMSVSRMAVGIAT